MFDSHQSQLKAWDCNAAGLSGKYLATRKPILTLPNAGRPPLWLSENRIADGSTNEPPRYIRLTRQSSVGAELRLTPCFFRKRRNSATVTSCPASGRQSRDRAVFIRRRIGHHQHRLPLTIDEPTANANHMGVTQGSLCGCPQTFQTLQRFVLFRVRSRQDRLTCAALSFRWLLSGGMSRGVNGAARVNLFWQHTLLR